MLVGMSDLSIRRAGADDAEAIAAIYNEGIEDRVATLETELRTPEERRAWLAARGDRHPVFLAERGDLALAWASLNPFNPRAAYAHVADLSIYVARGARGTGVGRALLSRTIDEARGLGFHKMVLVAFPTNTAGMRLYARMGFTTVGTYREQGCLDGRWVDVIVMEQILG
jgi:phosphinothricin acetyltransferase